MYWFVSSISNLMRMAHFLPDANEHQDELVEYAGAYKFGGKGLHAETIEDHTSVIKL